MVLYLADDFVAQSWFLLVAMETKMPKNRKKIISSETICSMRLRLYRSIDHISLYRFYGVFFMKIGSLVWLLWELKVAIDLLRGNRKMAFIVKPVQI